MRVSQIATAILHRWYAMSQTVCVELIVGIWVRHVLGSRYRTTWPYEDTCLPKNTPSVTLTNFWAYIRETVVYHFCRSPSTASTGSFNRIAHMQHSFRPIEVSFAHSDLIIADALHLPDNLKLLTMSLTPINTYRQTQPESGAHLFDIPSVTQEGMPNNSLREVLVWNMVKVSLQSHAHPRHLQIIGNFKPKF